MDGWTGKLLRVDLTTRNTAIENIDEAVNALEDVKKIESGIWLSEGKTGPARLRIKRRGKRVSHVLVTIRELDLIAVVDMDAARVVWAMTGSWRAPHQATVLEPGASTVRELDRRRGE